MLTGKESLMLQMPLTSEQPKYKHDCRECRFLRTENGADWYYCPKCDGGTIIGRFGDEGYAYWSSPIDIILRWTKEGYDGTEFAKVAQKLVEEMANAIQPKFAKHKA
jgi:hypothetical protein